MFSRYFSEIRQVIKEYKSVYEYSQDVVDIVQKKHWHAQIPHSMNTHGDLVEKRLVFGRIESKTFAPYTDFRGIIPYGEFSMISAAGLGSFYVQYTSAEYDWDRCPVTGHRHRYASKNKMCALSPYPAMWFTYNDGRRVDFQTIQPSPPKQYISPFGALPPTPQDHEWECRTQAVNPAHAIPDAINVLTDHRRNGILHKKQYLENNVGHWNQIINRATLKLRLLCWTLGIDVTVCSNIPVFFINQTELSQNHAIASQQSYDGALLSSQAVIEYDLALGVAQRCLEQAMDFINPYYLLVVQLVEQMKDLLSDWDMRPHVTGTSELTDMMQLLIKMNDKISRLEGELHKHGIFVDAVKPYTAPWSCEELGKFARCYSPEVPGLRRDMIRFADKPWGKIDPAANCHFMQPSIKQCHGLEIAYIEYTAPSFLHAAFNGAMFAIMPEAIGDLFWVCGFVSQRRSNQIKTLINVAMWLFIADYLDGFLQNFVQGYLISIVVAATATHLLKRAGCSESQARIAGNTAGFFVNSSLDTKRTNDMMTSTAYFVGSQVGLWAERELVQTIKKDSTEVPVVCRSGARS